MIYFRLFCQCSPIFFDGISVPNNFHHHLHSSILSRIIFNTHIHGIAKNIHDTHHNAFHHNTKSIENIALISSFDDTIRGTRILLSIN